MPNIALVWDFDGTLTPDDSTTKVVEHLSGKSGSAFWNYVKALRRDKSKPAWEHVLAMDAPIWMYALSRIAAAQKKPLNSEFFKREILNKIQLYDNVTQFLKDVKSLEKGDRFKRVGINIHHFIITAGLKDLVQLVFEGEENLMTWVFGCRYEITVAAGHPDEPESVPVFCMDETVKTRSLFEISKGVFQNSEIAVNTKLEKKDMWASFEDFIYIGDGDTDIPALSLVRSKGGLGVAVYNPKATKESVNKRLKNMRADKRADLVVPADFSSGSELYKYIEARCVHILQRYEVEKPYMLS